MECSKLTDFTIWGEDLALFIISLGNLHLMKVLNHSAQLVREMVHYRGSSSKLQEQDPFSLSFEETRWNYSSQFKWQRNREIKV